VILPPTGLDNFFTTQSDKTEFISP
jgi:hypothetical protein